MERNNMSAKSEATLPLLKRRAVDIVRDSSTKVAGNSAGSIRLESVCGVARVSSDDMRVVLYKYLFKDSVVSLQLTQIRDDSMLIRPRYEFSMPRHWIVLKVKLCCLANVIRTEPKYALWASRAVVWWRKGTAVPACHDSYTR